MDATAILIVLYLVFLVTTLVDIAMQRERDGWKKILMVTLLPTIGMVLWWIGRVANRNKVARTADQNLVRRVK